MTKARLSIICNQTMQLTFMSMLLIVPLIFYIKTYDIFEFNKLTVLRILTLITLILYITKKCIVGGPKINFSYIWPPLGLLLISTLLSTIFTKNIYKSVVGVYQDYEGLLTMINYFLIWFLVHQHVTSFQQVKKFLFMIILAGSLAALYGVAQNFGIDFIAWDPNTYIDNRFFGSLGNPNFLAAYLLMVLPLAMIFFLTAKSTSFKIIMLLSILIISLSILFTKSRGALYTWIVENILWLAYLLYDYKKQGRLWLDNRKWFLILGILAGLTLFSYQVRTTISMTLERTWSTLKIKEVKITPRLYIWRSALYMVKEHPLLGCGLDTFQISFPKYRLPEYWRLEWNGTPEKAHNFFLQIAATTGLLGLGAWLWLLTTFFMGAGRTMKNLSLGQRHALVSIIIAQIGFLIQNQFNFTVVAYGSLFWFFLGLGTALNNKLDSQSALEGYEDKLDFKKIKFKNKLIYFSWLVLIIIGIIMSLRFWLAEVFFKRGIIALNRRTPLAAVTAMSKSITLNPYREFYRVKYGMALESLAKQAKDKIKWLEQAEQVHKNTIKMNPINGYNYNNLGRVYKYWAENLDSKKISSATEAYNKASELDPYNVYFALELAITYMYQKRLSTARQILLRLIKNFPDFAVPYAYRGYIALQQGKKEEAYAALNSAISKDWRGDIMTCASAWNNLGIIKANQRELLGAQAAFEKSIATRSGYMEARLNLALVLEKRGLTSEAILEYKHILEQAPEYAKAHSIAERLKKMEAK